MEFSPVKSSSMLV